MPSTLACRRSLASLLPLLVLLLLSLSRSSITPSIMDSLPSPFTISVDGAAITSVSEDTVQDPVQAELGTDAAVFTLHDNKLRCGDWLLARNLTEDRSLLPKKVLWFKANAENEARVHPVTAVQDGDSYHLEFAGKQLTAKDGKVFVQLMGDSQSTAVVQMQQ